MSLDIQGDEDRARPGLRLHPRGEVWRVAEHLAGRFHNNRPGLNADACGQLWRALGGIPVVEVRNCALDRERSAHCTLGVVLLRLRIAEQSHQPVAELLQHMTAKIGHRSRSLVEIGIDEVAPVFGVQLRRDACRADEIAKHHCDRPALGGRRWSRTCRLAQSGSAGT